MGQSSLSHIKLLSQRGRTFRLWLYYCGMSCTFGALSSIVITYICPHAGGSGVPEIAAILNGCVVQ
jgi:H+/Cl- antiporter ClcA